MNIQNETQKSIVARISEGSIRIETREEYENLLGLFPEKASLHRAYADFLLSHKDLENAAKAYEQAARLYINTGRTLQAIVAEILVWSITKPTHEQGRNFHSAVQAARSMESPLQNFFAELSYPELIAVMLRLVRLRLPANHTVHNFGDRVDEIFFIVSGTLKETTYLPTGEDESDHRASIRQLSENDIFGDVFPLSQEEISKSDVESLTLVELVKINKQVLRQVCKKHPRIELLLSNLYKDPGETCDGRSWASVRRSVRHEIPIKVKVTIFQGNEDNHPITAEGFTKDISLGGACIDLGEKHWSAPMETLKDASVTIEINLPNANMTLDLSGTIVWSTKIMDIRKISILAGIQFDPLNDSDRDNLNEYCFGSDGEQNLLWNLWDEYIKGI